MKVRFSLIVLAVAMLSSRAIAQERGLADDPAFLGNAQRLEFGFLKASRNPLPYQAVRFRYILQKRLGVVRGLTSFPSSSTKTQPYTLPLPEGRQWVSGPGSLLLPEDEWQHICSGYHPLWYGLLSTSVPRSASRRMGYFALYGGERISKTLVCGYQNTIDSVPAERTDIDPLFVAPGAYAFRSVYDPPHHPEVHHEFSAVLVVAEPQGDDAIICEMIRENEDLLHAMLSTVHEPTADVLPVLQAIVDEYPDSSYADYARFALARRILRGTGWHAFRDPDFREKTTFIDRLQWLITFFNENNRDDDALRKEMGPIFGWKTVIDGERANAVNNVLMLRYEDEELDNAIDQLADVAHVSEEERREAIELLLEIDDTTFAYYPTARSCIWMVAHDLDEELVEQIAEEMNEDYFDSIEWIELMSPRIHRAREWRDFRIRYTPER